MQDYKEILETDSFYHIYNRANGNEKLFVNDGNYQYFLKCYDHYITTIADTFTYCLMPNHFHFLVRIKSDNIITETYQGFQTLDMLSRGKYLTKQFSNLFNGYTQAFNKQNKRMGSLFIPRYNRKKITSQEYLKNVINYIHQNPIHHGYANKLDVWEYSSFNSLIADKPTKLNKQEVFDIFDDKKGFLEYHNFKRGKDFGDDFGLKY